VTYKTLGYYYRIMNKKRNRFLPIKLTARCRGNPYDCLLVVARQILGRNKPCPYDINFGDVLPSIPKSEENGNFSKKWGDGV
jgi:hypothetical protein